MFLPAAGGAFGDGSAQVSSSDTPDGCLEGGSTWFDAAMVGLIHLILTMLAETRVSELWVLKVLLMPQVLFRLWETGRWRTPAAFCFRSDVFQNGMDQAEMGGAQPFRTDPKEHRAIRQF